MVGVAALLRLDADLIELVAGPKHAGDLLAVVVGDDDAALDAVHHAAVRLKENERVWRQTNKQRVAAAPPLRQLPSG